METTYLALLAAGLLLLAFSGDWRLALFYTFFVGFAQDPLRKIIPGQPQYMSGLVAISAALTLATLYASRNKISIQKAFKNDTQLFQSFSLFVLVIALGSVNTFLRTGSIELPILGSIIYFAPILAVWLGFQFSTRPGSLLKLMYFYVGLVLMYAATILMSFWGVVSPLFREIGEGLTIYLDIGYGIQGHCGLWRTAEIAAWHLGAGSCYAITLGVRSRKPLYIALSVLIAIGLMATAVLTGRRKVLTLVSGFIAIYVVLIAMNTRKITRENIFLGLGIIGISAALFVIGDGFSSLSSGMYGIFFRRITTVFGDVNTRFFNIGITGLLDTVNEAGIFGLGVGVTFQNVLRGLGFNVGYTSIPWGSEGGIGRIVAEIGIIGLVVIGVLIFNFLRLIFRIIRNRYFSNYQDYLLVLGLVAFLGASLPTFAAAGQVFADFFVIIFNGLSAGSILGLAYQFDQAALPSSEMEGSPTTV
jgi:hypothetical protein